MEQKLTNGQILVGINFNPSGDQAVNDAKQKCADLINAVEAHNAEAVGTYNHNLIKGEAIRRIMDAQMWIVKYLTFKG